MEFVFEKLSQLLAANQAWPLKISGSEFRIIDAMWPVTVRYFNGNRIVGQASNVLPGDYLRGMEFDAVEIINGPMIQNVTVVIASGGAGSDRITGSVEVIDGGKAMTLNNRTFVQSTSAGPVLGEYSMVQLFNPAGSGKNLFLSAMSISCDQQAAMNLRSYDVQLPTFYGNAKAKKMGGNTSAAEIRTGTNVAALGTLIVGDYVQAYSRVLFDIDEPIMLPPGTGVYMMSSQKNSTIYGTFEFLEESAT